MRARHLESRHQENGHLDPVELRESAGPRLTPQLLDLANVVRACNAPPSPYPAERSTIRRAETWTPDDSTRRPAAAATAIAPNSVAMASAPSGPTALGRSARAIVRMSSTYCD